MEELGAFRYHVYIEQTGKNAPYVDHGLKRMIEPLDATSTNLIARDGQGKLCGCVRITLASNGWQLPEVLGTALSSLNLFTKYGYLPFCHPFVDNYAGAQVPIVMYLNDIDHLRSMQSPFYEIVYGKRFPEPKNVALMDEPGSKAFLL